MIDRRRFIEVTLAGGAAMLVPAGWTPVLAQDKKHPNVTLLMSDAEDKTEKQVADTESFITQEVDAILISPKESAGLTGVVEKAMDANIPVFVLDRNVNTDKYTQWIGGDHVVN